MSQWSLQACKQLHYLSSDSPLDCLGVICLYQMSRFRKLSQNFLDLSQLVCNFSGNLETPLLTIITDQADDPAVPFPPGLTDEESRSHHLLLRMQNLEKLFAQENKLQRSFQRETQYYLRYTVLSVYSNYIF